MSENHSDIYPYTFWGKWSKKQAEDILGYDLNALVLWKGDLYRSKYNDVNTRPDDEECWEKFRNAA